MVGIQSLMLWVGLLLLLTIALAARRAHGSWTHPSGYFSLVWLATIAPGIAADLAPLEPLAIFLPSLFVMAFLLGTLAVGRATTPKRPPELFSVRHLALAVTLFGTCGLIAAISYVLEAVPPGAGLFSLETWLDIALRYSLDRYAGAQTETLAIRILVAINFAGAMLGGTLVAVGGSQYWRRAALPVAACIAITLVTTAKATFLLGVFGAIAGYLSARRFRSPTTGERRRPWLVAAAGALAFVVLVGAQAMRYGAEDGSDVALLAERLLTYITGQIYALSAWVRLGGVWTTDLHLGRYTFAGLYDMIGIHRREAGLYEYIEINDAAASSNVFTALRGLIDDFTLPGALILMCLLGVSVQLALRMSWGRYRLALCTAFLNAVYFFIGWSHVVSVYIYNSAILAVLLVAMTLLFATQTRSDGARDV